MTTVVEMLERLAQAGGKDKFAEIMSGFKTGLRNNNEMMRSIRNIEEITNSTESNCIKKNGVWIYSTSGR